MKTFFNGKLRIKTLIVTDQPATRSEVLARLLSPGGELVVLSDGKAPFLHLSYLELKEGKIRGNHFHKLRHEQFYLISGELQLYTEDVNTGEKNQSLIRPGEMVFIDPDVIHTFVPRTNGHALEFAPEAFNPTDVYKREIVRAPQ